MAALSVRSNNQEVPYALATGPIIGITAGVVFLLLCVGFSIAFIRKRRRKRAEKQRKPDDGIELN